MELHPALIEIVKVILGVNALSPDRIILLGYINAEGQSFSILNGFCEEVTDFVDVNLLVISENANADRLRYIDMIEQRCKPFARIICIILSRSDIQSQMEYGNRLAIIALQSGKVLYQKWETAPHIQKAIYEAVIKEGKEVELVSWYKRSHLFLQMAKVQFNLGNCGMAAFCIHQSLEQVLIMLIISVCGYRMGIHNPDRLLRMLRFHNDAVADIFPNKTAEEKGRLCLLKKVYINYRYRVELEVTEDDIRYFFTELGKLHAMADRIIYPKITAPILI
ncbi:HEPN domain-containing protein [Pseudobacter ginsenosidimutans]|uniref:HEPN domain-containing protein n=1 Tax=Pseudobacter ginsenosidimutans TaxID=661488 RepID=A0A4Q7MRX9_9BACT|nr:HEPN domain-containing protein [Pseudobacter ginsenosidimutans]QEC41684.1 HEPN domain-containing protein [Pseudobacter ginsenosidimutans]RZS71515.1 HEPN domain-containing protein [Pseudobacter ginsenosidimutans]